MKISTEKKHTFLRCINEITFTCIPTFFLAHPLNPAALPPLALACDVATFLNAMVPEINAWCNVHETRLYMAAVLVKLTVHYCTLHHVKVYLTLGAKGLSPIVAVMVITSRA
jgi:hypothetical protein